MQTWRVANVPPAAVVVALLLAPPVHGSALTTAPMGSLLKPRAHFMPYVNVMVTGSRTTAPAQRRSVRHRVAASPPSTVHPPPARANPHHARAALPPPPFLQLRGPLSHTTHFPHAFRSVRFPITMLATFPRSGNSWTRMLVRAGTGVSNSSAPRGYHLFADLRSAHP